MKTVERRLKNGTRCYIINKKGYRTKQAMFSVNFGSEDADGTDGAAHFLEHKVFEQKSMDVFKEFSSHFADVNAFTNINTTAYYFSCTDDFEHNLKTLLTFTANPYFTKENVEKEKGIIGEEIKMYEDDSDWRVYFNMLKNMYGGSCLKNSIAGSIESISNISAEGLEKIYNKYYCGNNSALVICGDVDIDKTFELAEELTYLKSGCENKRKPVEGKIENHLCSIKMPVSQTIFNIGFKECNFEERAAKRLCGSKIILDLICGRASEVYERLYLKGLIDRNMSSEYSFGDNYGFGIISGKSRNAAAIGEQILKKAADVKRMGINREDFERSRNKLLGMFIAEWDYMDSIAALQTDYAFKGIGFDHILDEFLNIKMSDVMDRLGLFTEENMVISLAEPG